MNNWDKAIARIEEGWTTGKMYRDRGRFGTQVCALGAIYAATAGEDALRTISLGSADPAYVQPTPQQENEYQEMVSQLASVIRECGFDHPSIPGDEGLVWRFNDSRGKQDVVSMLKKAQAKFKPITISPTESEAVEKVTRGWP